MTLYRIYSGSELIRTTFSTSTKAMVVDDLECDGQDCRVESEEITSRDEVLSLIYRMANDLCKSYEWKTEDDILGIVMDWNFEHEDAEIFMCDEYDEDAEEKIGFYIEDSRYTYEDMHGYL